MLPSFQVNRGGCSRSHGSVLATARDDVLDLGAHVVVRLVRIPPHVVFDRAVVRRRAGVREQVEPAVAAAARAADDDPRRERVEARRQDRVRLRVRPLPLELLERDDDLQHLLDRVDAAARLAARRGPRGSASRRAPPRPRPRSGSGRARPRRRRAGARSARPRSSRRAPGARSTISRVPLPTTSSSLTTWKTMSPRGSRPCSSATFDRPHRRGETALHVGRAAPVEPAVDDLAAERLLRPRAAVADRHDVDVRVERERAAAARARAARATISGCAGNVADGPTSQPSSSNPSVGEEVADEADAAPRLLGEVRRLLRLALGAEARSGRAAGPAAPSREASTASTTAAARAHPPTTRLRSARPRTRPGRVAAEVVAVRAEDVHAPGVEVERHVVVRLRRRRPGRCAPGRSCRRPRPSGRDRSRPARGTARGRGCRRPRPARRGGCAPGAGRA